MNTPRTKEVRLTASPMWDDWELATAGLKGTAKVPKRTLKRWEKEVAAWQEKNGGRRYERNLQELLPCSAELQVYHL